MTTILFSHDDSLSHVTPPGHPEQVERYRVIQAALAASPFAPLDRREAPIADRADLLRCHPESYIASVEAAVPERGIVAVDPDTHLSSGSLGAVMRAAGGAVAAVDAVLAGEARNAFVAMRPPGHHAETSRAMGFCLFGNLAIAARRALDHHGLDRVAVVDFDVHHGNGTQDLLWDEERALFISSHQMPLWPGSGHPSEAGAHGNVINVPLAPQTGSAAMRRAYDEIVFPALEEFEPQLVLVSAGFDAHAADPLAELNWTTEDFIWVTGRICDIAEDHAQARVVSVLEGGYDLDALAETVAAHVRVLMERGA